MIFRDVHAASHRVAELEIELHRLRQSLSGEQMDEAERREELRAAKAEAYAQRTRAEIAEATLQVVLEKLKQYRRAAG